MWLFSGGLKKKTLLVTVLFFISCWDSRGIKDLTALFHLISAHRALRHQPLATPVWGRDPTGDAGKGWGWVSCCPWKPNVEPWVELCLAGSPGGRWWMKWWVWWWRPLSHSHSTAASVASCLLVFKINYYSQWASSVSHNQVIITVAKHKYLQSCAQVICSQVLCAKLKKKG